MTTEYYLGLCRRDQDGRSGLSYVVEVILHLLDPLLTEFSASYVGKLILVFIKKVCILWLCKVAVFLV